MAPRVDREHLQQFVGKAVWIIGRLKEVQTVDRSKIGLESFVSLSQGGVLGLCSNQQC
jgi:hypothetical protein